ncbi:MAG: hypothetical protein ACTTH7_03665 [Treponema sp.]
MAKRKIWEVPKQRVSCTVIEVTPQMAEAWLQNNPENRPINEERVREYEDKMRRGEWEEKHRGGEPLIVMKEGELINGQHRLTAVVRNGKSIRMQVMVYERKKEITVQGL